MSKVSGNAVDVSLLRRVFRYAYPYRKMFVWSIILTILLAILAPLRPWLIQYTLDKFILFGDSSGLLNMSLLMLALLLIQTAVQYFHTFFTNILGQSVIKDLRVSVFNHISSLKLKYFDRTPLGQLITRTVSDLETIADIFSEG
jgi:ATP-binding cassette subfamily B protein